VTHPRWHQVSGDPQVWSERVPKGSPFILPLKGGSEHPNYKGFYKFCKFWHSRSWIRLLTVLSRCRQWHRLTIGPARRLRTRTDQKNEMIACMYFQVGQNSSSRSQISPTATARKYASIAFTSTFWVRSTGGLVIPWSHTYIPLPPPSPPLYKRQKSEKWISKSALSGPFFIKNIIASLIAPYFGGSHSIPRFCTGREHITQKIAWGGYLEGFLTISYQPLLC